MPTTPRLNLCTIFRRTFHNTRNLLISRRIGHRNRRDMNIKVIRSDICELKEGFTGKGDGSCIDDGSEAIVEDRGLLITHRGER